MKLNTEVYKDLDDEVMLLNLRVSPRNTAIDEIDLVRFETNAYDAN